MKNSTQDAKISYDIWLYNLEQAEAGLPFRTNRYVLHQHNGRQSFFPTFLINTHKVEAESDMLAYIQRLSGVATALDQLLARAKPMQRRGPVRPVLPMKG